MTYFTLLRPVFHDCTLLLNLNIDSYFLLSPRRLNGALLVGFGWSRCPTCYRVNVELIPHTIACGTYPNSFMIMFHKGVQYGGTGPSKAFCSQATCSQSKGQEEPLGPRRTITSLTARQCYNCNINVLAWVQNAKKSLGKSLKIGDV